MEESGSQRKRIAVACGRCRQRKIRCSGDTGSGEGCSNCIGAGVNVCQFLRVSAQEVHQGMRSNPSGVNFNSPSRKNAGRSMSGARETHHCVDTNSGYDATHDQYDARHLSGGRNYVMQGWHSGYSSDEGMEYGVPQRQVSIIGSSSMMGQYGGQGSLTRAESGTGNAPLIDPDMGYGSSMGAAGVPLNISCLSGTSLNEHLYVQGGRHAAGGSFRPDLGSGPLDSTYTGYGQGSVAYSSEQLSSSSLDRSAGLYTTAPGPMMSTHDSSSAPHGLTYQYTDTTGARDVAQQMLKLQHAAYALPECISPRN